MTTNEIATTAGSSLAIAAEQTEFTSKQVAALRQLGVDKATEGDLTVFFHQCQRTGLDPFARQIYMIGRNSKEWNPRTREEKWVTKYTIQTGIDGFRLIARRAVNNARGTFGYEDTLWCGEDGRWTDVWLQREAPRAAKVTVIRDGSRYPAVALMTEYAGTDKNGNLTKMWREKGALMLAKCAEALALRKAFPQDLSGLYTSDEMQQSSNEREPQQSRQQQESITDAIHAAAVDQYGQVDIDSLLSAIEAADSKDALRGLWSQSAALPAEGRTLTRDLITARLADLEAPAAETEPEPEPEPEPVSEPTLDDAIDAEVVQA